MTDRKRPLTRVGGDASQKGDRKTQIFPGNPGGAPEPPAWARGDNRRIVGVLVSYTWDPGGQLFAVRQGQTHIGSGYIGNDPNRGPVEVQCSQDSELSKDHAYILVQQSRFYIQDLASTNGTTLNGEPLRPQNLTDLPSPAEIKAGKTVFHFVKLDVVPGESIAPAPPQDARESKRPKTVLE